MSNPVLIELTRGPFVESLHRGAMAVAGADGVMVAVGAVDAPVFPRSAIKPLQAIPFVATGTCDRFAFAAPELALACASHSGTPAHVALAGSVLARSGLSPAALACGVHEPTDQASARELIRAGAAAGPLHHNCSGKHAAMLATAAHMGEPAEGYWRPGHPVQQRIAAHLERLTGLALDPQARGIDGCSVPNWAIPLTALARGFACFATGEHLPREDAAACARIADACWMHPDLVAGLGRLDTLLMQRLGRKVLAKSGAEGVYCGAFPERGLGFALKIDDGAKRAAEAAAMALITRLYPEADGLGPARRLVNWRGLDVGEMRATPALESALRAVSR